MLAQVIAICIFLGMFLLIILDQFERHVITLVSGALVLILVFGVCMHSPAAIWEALNLRSFFTAGFWYGAGEESTAGINWSTILFIAGMMIMVEGLGKAGFFRWLCLSLAKLVHYHVVPLLICFMCLSAVLSMFIDSITVVLFLATVTLELAQTMKFDPVPMILSEIFCANLGGAATMCGDPPNIMIGSATGLTFFDFLAINGPAVLIILLVSLLMFYVMYGKKMGVSAEKQASVMQLHAHEAIKSQTLFKKSVVMIALVALAFVVHGALHIEPSVVALTAAAIMLLIGKSDVEHTLMDVEWATIGFFAGLFVVVGGLAETGVIEMMAYALIDITGGDMMITIIVLVWASAIISSFLDNIPLVATLIPIITTMEATGMDVTPLWWAVSLGACIGGIGTLIGASANVVLAGISGKYGHPITFMDYTKVGFPMMLVFTAISCVYLVLRFCVFV